MDVSAPLILIGGTGFLGQAFAAHAAAAGREVEVIGRGDWGSGRAAAIASATSGRGAAIVDLAHAAVPGGAAADPAGDVVANLAAVDRHLEFAEAVGAGLYLFVSSGGAVYGDQGDQPLAEEAPTAPISPYGIAKLASEQRAISSSRDGVKVTIVRPSNIYGPGQAPFRGQGLVATAFGAALRGQPVTLFGDGSQRRDYLFVDDFCSGLEGILAKGVVGGVYNLGCGAATRADDLLSMIGQITARDGFPLTVLAANARPTDVAANTLDVTNLTRDTGWTPRVDLGDGLERTWAWIRAQ